VFRLIAEVDMIHTCMNSYSCDQDHVKRTTAPAFLRHRKHQFIPYVLRIYNDESIDLWTSSRLGMGDDGLIQI
jgi:hypothetical protein